MGTSFGQWLKRRRKALDMTQEELARRVGCAEVTIFKIEADERRPSKQIAALLAQHLTIPRADADGFLKFARSGAVADATSALWETPFHPPTNLPTAPTPLIGREQDISSVCKRLLHADTQLLTLVGPPGIGKTRLSLAAAHLVLNEFSDGVFLVLLASVSDPEQVPRMIIQTLGVVETGPHSSQQRLKHHLREKHMLLVLDNFEQVLPAAPYVAELIAVCPLIKILVTSRAPLRVRGERQFPVPALALPDLNRIPELQHLPDYAAVELFVERAQAVKPDFALTSENAQSVAAICHRLDGLPLAIELLSARVKMLPPAALLERLHGRLLLASDGLRDLESRHRTLYTAIGWSYDLLTEPEQVLFRRLGVFLGGWTIEAAEVICQPDNSVVDGLASLLDKSLVQQKTASNSEPRFTMLETIREYALEHLTQRGEEPDLRRQHANFFLAWAKADKPDAHDRMEQEQDNLRQALGWYLSNDLKAGLALVLSLIGYWLVRGRLIEGRLWVEKYLAACADGGLNSPDNLRHLLNTATQFAYFQDEVAQMRYHAETLLALGRNQQDKASTAYGLFALGMEMLRQQDFERAMTMFEESLLLSRQADLPEHTGSTLLMMSLVAVGQKNYERADVYNLESLTLYRQLGNQWGESMILNNSATIRAEQGDYGEARTLLRQALQISRQLNDRRLIAVELEQLADLASLEKGEHIQAVRLMGAAQALRDSIFAAVEPLGRVHHESQMARLRANLDDMTFAAAWAEGRLITLEQAIEYALSE